MLRIPSLLVFPPRVMIYGISKQTGCENKIFGGTSREGITIINSSEFSTPSQFHATFAHEIAHEIHSKVNEKHPKFNEKWAKTKGGYAREYGMANQNEDIATVAEIAIIYFINGVDLRQIKPIDDNYEAFHQKLRLLKEYGFFPKALMVP